MVSGSGSWPVFSFPVRVLCRTCLRDGRTCQLRDRESYTDLRDRVWSSLARSLHTFFCNPVDSAVPLSLRPVALGDVSRSVLSMLCDFGGTPKERIVQPASTFARN